MLLAYAGSNVGGLIFLGVVVALIIDMVISSLFGAIAEMKGYSRSMYKWICFFLGLPGWIMVAALPDRAKKEKSKKELKEEMKDVESWV